MTMNYFTKWPIAKLLKKVTVKAVNKFIYKKIICEYEYLEVLQSN